MPTYVYLCSKCNKSFSKVEKFNDNNKVKCLHCNKKNAIRQFSPPTILYKGDGWYSKSHKD